MQGFRLQFRRAKDKFLSNGKLGSINCYHCEKAIVFDNLGATCPYCDSEYFGFLGMVERLLLDQCEKCRNVIKYFYCPHCHQVINTDIDLPETKLIANLFLGKTAITVFNEIIEQPENASIKNFLGDKVFSYLNNLFHDFDMKSARNATEKMEEIHKQNIITIDELERLAKFNKDKAQGTTEHIRADLLKEAVKYYEKLPSLLQVYLITSLFGGTQTKIEDIQYDKELRDALIKIKEEELRKMKIENDDLDDKRRRNNEL